MPYALGIDLGTARTVAAVSRNRRDGWSEPVVVPLDATADRPGVASVLHFTGDDTVEVGEVGGLVRADRVARDFLDRVGDEVPLALGGQHYPAESLAAALVAWVVDRVEALEGMTATHLVVTHPVSWGAHRRASFQSALRELNLPELTMLPRPVAAAEAYAATERLEVGDEVAVYSLGSGRFEAAVLRRGSFGFELRSQADSTDVLGGGLMDDLLADHTTARLGELPGGTGAVAAMRAACVAAKERLSSAVAVTIPAPPGAKMATVSVSRTDFETLIRPVVEHTVRILQRAVAAADSSALRAVVLVGGCANVPLIAELVSAAVRVRVVAAEDPTAALARGAALAAGRVAKPTIQAPAVPPLTQHTDLMRFDDLSPEVPDIGPPPPRPPVELAPLDPPARGLARLARRIRPTDTEDEPAPNPTRTRRDEDSQEIALPTHPEDDDLLAPEDPPADTPPRRAPANPAVFPPPRRPHEVVDGSDPEDPEDPEDLDDVAWPAAPPSRAGLSHPGFPPVARPTPPTGPTDADIPDRAAHPSFPTRHADRPPRAGHPSFPPTAHHTPANHQVPHEPDRPALDVRERPARPTDFPTRRGEAPSDQADVRTPRHDAPATRHEIPADLPDPRTRSNPSFPPARRHEPVHSEDPEDYASLRTRSRVTSANHHAPPTPADTHSRLTSPTRHSEDLARHHGLPTDIPAPASHERAARHAPPARREPMDQYEPVPRHEAENEPAPRHERARLREAVGRHEAIPRHHEEPARHAELPRRRRRAEPDDDSAQDWPAAQPEARHAELPGPRGRTHHALPGRHSENEPALAQHHRRRRRRDEGDDA